MNNLRNLMTGRLLPTKSAEFIHYLSIHAGWRQESQATRKEPGFLLPGPAAFRMSRRSGAITLAFLFTAARVCPAALPDMPNVPEPNPEPVAPSGWDVFAPPVTATPPVSGAPTIAEWTRTGAPDDSLILTGDKLSVNTGINQGKDTQFVIYGQTTGNNSFLSAALIQRLDGLKAAITLPAGLPAWSTYMLWPENFSGYGAPVAVNRTEAWWVGPDNAAFGDTVSVYGRNLSHHGGTTASWVYIKPVGPFQGQWAAVTSVNPYRVQFTVPTFVSDGTYEVWIHNGHGGKYGWSGPLTMTINAPLSWNSSSAAIFNVRNYGARGDGVTDDTAAILAACGAEATYQTANPASYPTVYFPAGTYMMSRGVSLRANNTRYAGAGMNLTFLKCNANFATDKIDTDRSMGLFFDYGGAQSNVEIQDLTLDTNSVIPPWAAYALNLSSPCDNFRLGNVCIKELTGGNVEGCAGFNSTTHLSIAGCTFIGGEIFFLGGSQMDISNCSFINNSQPIRSIGLFLENECSVTHCTARDDYDPGAPGQGRFIAALSNWGTQSDVYIGDNQTNMSVPKGNNSGEQVLCEGGTTQYSGRPTAAATDPVANISTITFNPLNNSSQTNLTNLGAGAQGLAAVIVNGKGLGQYRLITGYNGAQTITVSPAWNVLPDATSTVIIEYVADRWVAYHNNLAGDPSSYDTMYSAMTALAPVGGCYDWIGDSNTVKYMNRAVTFWETGDQYFHNQTDPCYFIYFANNLIQSCYHGIGSYCSNQNATQYPEIGYLGTVFRNNTLSNITTVGAFQTTAARAVVGSPMDLTLFEHNNFTNLPEGFACDLNSGGSWVKNTVLYKNTFDLGTAPVSGSFGINFGVNTQLPALRGNTWTGFATTYAGPPPGAILEIPVRNFNLSGAASGGVQTAYTAIWNSGTAPLNWLAVSSAAWLKLSSVGGTVADQNSSAPVALTCNPAGLQPGAYTGTITVSGAAQTKELGVTFTVLP
jgi:hypothetical protein